MRRQTYLICVYVYISTNSNTLNAHLCKKQPHIYSHIYDLYFIVNLYLFLFYLNYDNNVCIHNKPLHTK
jgi:hypothetical protein